MLRGVARMAGGQGSLAPEQALPRSTALQHSDLRLCLTTLVVSLAFLATASLRLGHYGFQATCLIYLLKSYFLTFLYALAGLTILAIIAFFVSKGDEQVLFRRYKLIAFFVPAMMVVNLTYFSLKAGSAAFHTNMGLIAHEYPIWKAVRPAFALIPLEGFKVFDFTYTVAWFVSLSALPLSLIFLKPSRAVRLNCAVMLLLAFTALGNTALLTYSPVYEFPGYFAYLPAILSTWKIHHASLTLTHKLISLKAVFFTSSNAGFFQPVAAFPAFHTSYAFLLFLAFRDRRYIKFVFLAFFVLVVAGGLVLGYHGFLDTTVAAAASAAIFLPMPKETLEESI